MQAACNKQSVGKLIREVGVKLTSPETLPFFQSHLFFDVLRNTDLMYISYKLHLKYLNHSENCAVRIVTSALLR